MARLIGGTVLVVFGVISGFLPVLQGWVFILAGLTLMAPESERAKMALDWAKERFQRSTSGIQAVPGASEEADDVRPAKSSEAAADERRANEI